MAGCTGAPLVLTWVVPPQLIRRAIWACCCARVAWALAISQESSMCMWKVFALGGSAKRARVG